jgi:hypothetical protein
MIREVDGTKREAARVAYWSVDGERMDSACCDGVYRVGHPADDLRVIIFHTRG